MFLLFNKSEYFNIYLICAIHTNYYYKLIWGITLLGGNLWVNGEEGAGGVYFGADEALPSCERLYSDTNHQQEN